LSQLELRIWNKRHPQTDPNVFTPQAEGEKEQQFVEAIPDVTQNTAIPHDAAPAPGADTELPAADDVPSTVIPAEEAAAADTVLQAEGDGDGDADVEPEPDAAPTAKAKRGKARKTKREYPLLRQILHKHTLLSIDTYSIP
jgi:hypothetical protein